MRPKLNRVRDFEGKDRGEGKRYEVEREAQDTKW